MDTERCANFAVALVAFMHGKDVSAESSFNRVAEIALG
jgi:hypothetical protein